MNYVPLNIKTHYEMLGSLIKIGDLVSFASSNNVSALGITDCNLFGTLELIDECKKYNIKPIVGVSFEIDSFKMILYAKNYKGYINLLNLVSLRNSGNITIDDFKDKNNDLICVTDDYENYLNYKMLYEQVYLSYSNREDKEKALSISDKIVYIKESRCINQNDLEYLPYLSLIREGKNIGEYDSFKSECYLNYDIDEADAKNTFLFSNNIDIQFPKIDYSLPKYSSDSDLLLEKLCLKGISKRLGGKVSDIYSDRLKMELDVIKSMNFTDYFLIVYDFILHAKKNGILIGPGRGSAAGSLVSYSLGITEIDPIKYGLIFERFLNKDRVTMPDIDVDIEYLRRDEVVSYVKSKYGESNVANIITFSSLSIKQAVRDIGKVLSIPTSKIDSISALIKDDDTHESLNTNSSFMSLINENDDLKKLFRICSKIEGIKRHTSIHAAGVVISSDKICNRAPIYYSNGIALTGYTMEYLERVGLIKIDFLAIKNLSIILNICKKISSDYKKDVVLSNIPLNDKKTLDIFYNGDTSGIFQFESQGMKSFLKSLKVKSFDDLVLAIALYRPGPKDNIPSFIKRREGKEKVPFICEELDSIIGNTNGIIVYQEQILDILKRIGGFSYSEADIIRRAMSKKKEDVIAENRDRFVKGACNNGLDNKTANMIYDLVLKFANYGFNKSHSVAYSLVAYQMAYLKAHFTSYFMCELLNDSMSSTDKLKNLINESKKYGIVFKYVNVNYSSYEFINDKDTIYYPLNIINGISKDNALSIIKERTNGKFASFSDFVKRMYNSHFDDRTMSALIMSGALDDFGLNRKTMISNLPSINEYAKLCFKLGMNVEEPLVNTEKEYDYAYLDSEEYKLFGFYAKNHPASKYFSGDMIYVCDASKYFNKVMKFSVLIDSVREITTKKGEKMAFLNVSDETSSISLTVFPSDYKNFDAKKGDILTIKAKVERRFSDYQLTLISYEKM